jgi:hypothetical protein
MTNLLQSSLAREIEQIFRERTGKDAIYLPSGRIGIFLAISTWLKPGDRVLMSPVNDDVVFYTLLASGVRPVLAPADPATGNLDPAAVDERVWAEIDAVLTTNLYGIPDDTARILQLCNEHGVLLIEDTCQAVDIVSNGRRVGADAPLAVFSFSKQVQGVGGILAFEDFEKRPQLLRERSRLLSKRPVSAAVAHDLRAIARSLARRRLPAADPAQRERGTGHRMPYVLDTLKTLCRESPSLQDFDHWMRVDNPDYLTEPTSADLRRTLRNILALPAQRQRRIEGMRRLLDLELTPDTVNIPEDQPLHRVPLFIRNREAVVRQFAEHGLLLDYIYDPPLDAYVPPEIADRFESPPLAMRWTRDVLPVNPLDAERFLEISKRLPALEAADAE